MADENQGPPQNWAERVLASAWQFRLYRTRFTRRRLTADDYATLRQFWSQYRIGVGPRRRLRSEEVGPWMRNLALQEHGAPSLDQPTPPGVRASYNVAKQKLQKVKNVFGANPNLQYMNTLGFGGNGIAIRYRNHAPPRLYDFVVKVGLRSWESSSIRAELRETRKMARAAHVIQMLPRRALGLGDQPKYPFEYPHEDDSSETEESSGDESRDDGPGPDVPKTRRPRNDDERNEMRLKTAQHEQRINAAYERIENRDNIMRERQEQGVNPPLEAQDPIQQRRADFMFMEIIANGDLEHLLYRLNATNTIVPNRVLWGFWLCLVRSCVAMAYPPRKFHPRRREPPQYTENMIPSVNNRDNGKTVGRDLYEEIPDPRRRWAQKRHVHFDIDPQNILIAGLDVLAADNEHKIIPRLKLTDFGLAKEVKPNKRNVYYLNLRGMAKHGYLAPEQFGLDWDFIQPHEDDGTHIYPENGGEICEEPVAGNYGPHTNVWQIAIVAWQLMTQMHAPVPPQLQPKTGDHEDLPDNYCPLLLDDPEYEIYDFELRETIARCMAHDPRERPSLRQLLRQAKSGINKIFANEPDADIKTWVQTLIFDP
ncbi:kinase-like domain-containing protein [Xylaria telfairii]|nr:kinase-like domain-containing protein [Xylaria telfairii]